MREHIEQAVARELGATKNVIRDALDYRLFLDYESIRSQKLDVNTVKRIIVETAMKEKDCVYATACDDVATAAIPQMLRERMLMGYYPGRSGDIYFVVKPSHYEFGSWSSPTGTTHGAWNPYDAHIPCLFLGWKVKHGATSREVHINDIAPTVCQMLHIQQPDACTGEPITEITR